MKTSEGFFLSAVLWAAVLLTPPAGAAEQAISGSPGQTAPPAAAAQAVAESQAEARRLLMHMAEFLSQAQRFSVTVRSGYDVVQESGQKIEFGELRTITVSRPDRLRIEVEQSDGERHLILFDGQVITAFGAADNVYAKAAMAGDLDQAIAYFIRELGMRLPLAVLLVSRLPAELDRRVQAIDYVERTTLLEVPTHHLAGRTETVDFQVWVADGDQPLPWRVVLTYKEADGRPQYWAQFSKWNLSPEVTDAMFAFIPPPGAEEIPFLSEFRQATAQTPEATEKSTTTEKSGGQP